MSILSDISPDAVRPKIAEFRRQAHSDARGAAEDAWQLIERFGALAATDRTLGTSALNSVFAAGRTPTDLDGDTEGTLVVPLVQPLLDRAAKAFGSLWVPWQGMRFDKAKQRGTNSIGDLARWPVKLIWPQYRADEDSGRRHAFDFESRIEPGTEDADVEVLVLDYGPVRSNPSPVVKSLRDELVEIVSGVYLGKVFFRNGGRYTPVGFFALRAADLAGRTLSGSVDTVRSALTDPGRDVWRLPKPVALLNLCALRDDLRAYDPHDLPPNTAD